MEATASMLQARDWSSDSSLPTDVLVLILERMRWSTHPSVVLVCQQWRSARLFGIELTFTIEIASSIRNNSGEWEDWKLAENHLDWSRFRASPVTNPVIAVYDPCRHDEGFKILDKLNSFGFKGEDSYLLESNQGELMVVLIERHGKMVHVVKLNEQRMEWEKYSLHGQTVFTGSQTTMMKKTKFNWMEIKVFFLRYVSRYICYDRLGHGATIEYWGTERADYKGIAIFSRREKAAPNPCAPPEGGRARGWSGGCLPCQGLGRPNPLHALSRVCGLGGCSQRPPTTFIKAASARHIAFNATCRRTNRPLAAGMTDVTVARETCARTYC
uniref:F-box domain-containing protein n=1 Tax=Oryza nivara TaxID=4536 RepID=A0A0E0IIT0_ORYNI